MVQERGFSLLEVLISMMLIGITSLGIAAGLIQSSTATITNKEHTTAQTLVEGQIESVHGQPYDATNNPPQYDLITGIPVGYELECNASRMDPEGDGVGGDDGLQQVVVTVRHTGKVITTLEAYKVR